MCFVTDGVSRVMTVGETIGPTCGGRVGSLVAPSPCRAAAVCAAVANLPNTPCVVVVGGPGSLSREVQCGWPADPIVMGQNDGGAGGGGRYHLVCVAALRGQMTGVCDDST